MDVQQMVQQLIGSATQDQSIFSSLMAHPYSTLSSVTGEETITSDMASQALTAFSAMAAGKTIDFDTLPAMASNILAENNGSVHTLADSLLGSGQDRGIDITNGIDASVLNNLGSVLFSGNSAGIDLTDGIGLDDILGIAGKFFGLK